MAEPKVPSTITDEQMAKLRCRFEKAHPGKLRFDTSKEAVAERHEQNRRHRNRRFN